MKHDPDGDALAGLMMEWRAAFGSAPTTVRKAVDAARHLNNALHDAMLEFPVEERGEINRNKLGWLIKRNADRIVAGYAFQQGLADGRVAWSVVKTPVSPVSPGPFAETVTNAEEDMEVEF